MKLRNFISLSVVGQLVRVFLSLKVISKSCDTRAQSTSGPVVHTPGNLKFREKRLGNNLFCFFLKKRNCVLHPIIGKWWGRLSQGHICILPHNLRCINKGKSFVNKWNDILIYSFWNIFLKNKIKKQTSCVCTIKNFFFFVLFCSFSLNHQRAETTLSCRHHGIFLCCGIFRYVRS